MVGLFPKLVVSASMAAGVGLFAGAPALAAGLQGASTTADILVYCSNGTNTFLCDNSNLGTAPQGDLTAPGGNVELFADSETAPGLAKFLSGTYSTLSGTLNGQAIQFRYGGQGIASGQVEAGDGNSHNGTYLCSSRGPCRISRLSRRPQPPRPQPPRPQPPRPLPPPPPPPPPLPRPGR